MPQINIPWNKYEVALLAEASIKVAQGVISRKEAVSQLSKRLRYAVIKLGVILSDTYRNENGIGLQLQSMDYCLTGGKKGLSSHSKLFEEIALLVNDKDEFSALLSEAYQRYPKPAIYSEAETSKNKKDADSSKGKVSDTPVPTYRPKDRLSTISLTEELKGVIYELVDQRRQIGGHSFKISDIYEAFSSELKSCGVKNNGELRLLLAREYPEWWISNLYVLIDKSTFKRRRVKQSVSASDCEQTKIGPSASAKTDSPNAAEEVSMSQSKTDILEPSEAATPPRNERVEIYQPKSKTTIRPLSVQFKKIVHDRVSFLLIEGKSVVGLAGIYRYFKDEFNGIGIYTYGDLKRCLQVEFPSWIFVNYFIKSLGVDSRSNVKINVPILPSDLTHIISKFAEERLYSISDTLSVNNIFMKFKRDLTKIKIYTSTILKDALEQTFPSWKFQGYKIVSLGKIETSRQSDTEPETHITLSIDNKDDNSGLRSQNATEKDTRASKLKTVLLKNFARGYRLDSIIERRKLIRLYEEFYGESCDIPIDSIDQTVKKLGIVSSVKVYFPELMLSADSRNKIKEYLQSRFDSGVEYIYYVAIQKAFDSELLDSQIVNLDLMKDFLKLLFPQYYYHKDFIAIRSGIRPDIDAEVFRFVKEAYSPVTEQDVNDALYFLPKDGIHASYSLNSDILISNNRNNERFHIDNFVISHKDIDTITRDINQIISTEEYISWNDLVVYLRTDLPHLFSDNPQITEYGIRNALKVLFKRKFNINNNVVCSVGDEITVERILRRFIGTNDTFSLLEVKELTSSFGTGIYWDQLTREAVRIDESRFVSKRSVNFDVQAIDKVLEEFCPGKYIPLESVSLFSLLPICGFPWNSFLLENYVDRYSVKFKVIHNQYLQRSVRGAIVRKDAKIESLDDLILDFLVSSKEQYTAEEALDALKEEKLIAKARYEGIDHIVEKAMLMRQNTFE